LCDVAFSDGTPNGQSKGGLPIGPLPAEQVAHDGQPDRDGLQILKFLGGSFGGFWLTSSPEVGW
jgi:hypothetical protein